MITLRPSTERGHADHGWLDARHTFSFARYYDPAHMHWSDLRVLNQDRIRGGGGFPTHPHENMEIVTYVLDGALEHRDSMGNGSRIVPGDVQFMSAGSGVAHSEFNASADDDLHLLQMWVLPAEDGGEPRYGQTHVAQEARRGRLVLAVAPESEGAPIAIGQDARMYVGSFDEGEQATLAIAGRRVWVHVARGSARVNGQELGPGDGAGLEREEQLDLVGVEAADVVVWDLA